MNALIVCGLVVLLLWALAGRKLERWGVSGPLALVALGAIAGIFFGNDLSESLNTHAAEKVVELILAVLLFVDATEVRRGFLGGEGGIVARLLAIALPLSLVLTVIAGGFLVPGSSWAVILVIACIVIPTDFSAATGLLRDARLPGRIRHTLNIESGYNDGIVSPLFAFALVASEAVKTGPDLLPAVETAVWASVSALVVGAVIGSGVGLLAKQAVRANWVTEQSLRLGIVVIPLLVYVVTVAINGNGFVAAFIAGIAFRTARIDRRRTTPEERFDHRELSALDDIGVFSALGMWFLFGAMTTVAIGVGLDWGLIVFAVLALTALRMVPIYLAMLGSQTTWRERTAIGLAGPRGTASIVFGLLAFNALNDDDGNVAIYLTIIVVLGSVILHGVIVPRITPALLKTGTAGGDRAVAGH